jgi:hypothetical protein
VSQKIHYSKGTLAVHARRPAFSLPSGYTTRGEYHITVLDPVDARTIKQARGWSGSEFEKWAKKQEGTVIPGTPEALGIGRASRGSDDAFYEVIEWPEAQAWRAKLGLGPKDLHVTVGFKGADVHGVPKDKSTIIPYDRLYALAAELSYISTQLE